MCRNVVISPVISGPIILAIITGNPKSQIPKPKSQAKLGFPGAVGLGIWDLGFGMCLQWAAMVDGARFLSAEQFLLTTLIVKLAVIAVLATMLARYRRFRHILIFERRAWGDRAAVTAAGAALHRGDCRAPHRRGGPPPPAQLRGCRPDARGRIPRGPDRRALHRGARRVP